MVEMHGKFEGNILFVPWMLWICSTFSHLFGPPHGFDPGLHPVAKISLGLNPPEEMDVFFFTVMKLLTISSCGMEKIV